MKDNQQVISPETFDNGSGELNGTVSLHVRLRKMILDGTFPPGSRLSQVKLAETFGVGRIPLREALRMLQNEGLVEAEHNQRTRIPAFDPSVLDSLYASRILLEALSIRLTVPLLEKKDIDAIEQALVEMDAAAVQNDIDRWEQPHRLFHALLISHAGSYLCQILSSYGDRCEYYRRMYHRYISSQSPARAWGVVAAEHQAIVDACIEGQGEVAAHRLALHLARTALTVLGQMTPDFDSKAVRIALQTLGTDTQTSLEMLSKKQTHKGI
jgi:DNA-binding GntR family transcriptional regulator